MSPLLWPKTHFCRLSIKTFKCPWGTDVVSQYENQIKRIRTMLIDLVFFTYSALISYIYNSVFYQVLLKCVIYFECPNVFYWKLQYNARFWGKVKGTLTRCGTQKLWLKEWQFIVFWRYEDNLYMKMPFFKTINLGREGGKVVLNAEEANLFISKDKYYMYDKFSINTSLKLICLGELKDISQNLYILWEKKWLNWSRPIVLFLA